MRRRKLLTASAIAVAGLAGCSSGSGSDTESGTPDGGRLATPVNAVKAFYQTLYGEDDLEGANAMYHPKSDEPPGKPEDFSEYGGLESMTADIQSTELVSKSDGTAEVRARIKYSTPVGSAIHSDWFILRKEDGEWLVDVFLPESERDGMSDQEIDDAMDS